MRKIIQNLHPWLGICLAAMAFGATADAVPPRVAAITFDIKSQPIADALNEFGQQSGIQILFYSEVANGFTAPALIGAFTPDEALIQLLSHTGLTYSRINERTVAIHRVVSTVPEGKATRSEAVLPVMQLANYMQISEEPNNEMARGAGSQQEVDRQDSSEKRRKPRIEEVIVTAQKRAERLQDVPISVAVVSADQIDQRGLVNAEDYLRGIPGTNQVDQHFGQSIIIRGIETTTSSQSYSSGSTVATYFGETPTTNSAGLNGGSNVDLKLVDIERVEVLRGPQGTAFGNSSMGGAVRTIPVAPNLDLVEGKVAAGYSITSGTGGDNHNVQAVGNLPLLKDRLAIRATAYSNQESGFYRNVADSDAAFQAAVVTRYGAEAFATGEEEVGSYYVVGGRIAALFQASDDLRFTLSYLSQKAETDGSPVATSGSNEYEQTLLQVAPEHVIRGQKGGQVDRDIDIANATMEYNLGWADLLASYSHTTGGTTESYPYTIFGSANAVPASAYSVSDHREHVGEVRLATHLDGAWNFLAGLYAEDLKDDVFWDERWYGAPTTNTFVPPGTQIRILGFSPERRNLKQKAAFGEASWELVQRLTLTAGVRAYKYDRIFQFDGTGPFWGDLHVRQNSEASGENYRANLSYKPSDDTLIYAGWSQGFRVGQLQRPLPAGLCDRDADGIADGTDITIESSMHVDSDSVDSYEIGGKVALLDRRLRIDAAIFRMDWSDIPVAVRAGVLGQNCGIIYTANAGEAVSEGAEVQASFQITEPLRVDFGGSLIHAKLTKDIPAQNISSGNRLPGSPEINANLSLQYGFEIGGRKASVRADSIYVGSFYGNLQESPNTKSGDYVKLDASARVEIGNLDIDLFVRNLTNEDAFTFRRNNARSGQFYGYRLRPRTIGFQLGYAF